MEAVAIAVVRVLAVLDLPLGLLGIVVGLGTAIILVPRVGRSPLPELGLFERIAVGLAGGVAMLGLVGALETTLVRRVVFPPLAIVFAVSVIVAGLPAVVWRSRWRGAAEGVATAGISVAAILSGFTIGALFVPLVALMLGVCFLRLFHAARAMRRASSPRLDSPA